MHILFVGNSEQTHKLRDEFAPEKGFIASYASSGQEGKELACLYSYDLLLLDYGVQDITCLEIIKELRRQSCKIPILVIGLSKIVKADDIVLILDAGADDCLNAPFYFPELQSRLRALIRRFNGYSHGIIQIGNVTIDTHKHIVTVNGNPVELTNKEQALLECLALRKGAVLTKESLLSHLYGGMDEPEIRIIDAFVWRVRKKLKDAGQEGDYMQTVWGRGYRFSDQELR